MPAFTAPLVPGTKPPYERWTFLLVPHEVGVDLGPAGPIAVRGTLAGVAYRGTIHRSDGQYRMVVRKEWIPGQAWGDVVAVEMERDDEPRPVDVPVELQAVLDGDAELSARFAGLPPAHRRAWAEHVGEAKRAETRAARAQRAITGIRGKQFPR